MPQIQLSTGRTYFRLEGNPDLPVIALLHPIGADHSLWDKVVPLLKSRFRVLRPDLRGHGGSEVTVGPYSVEALAEEFLELCRKLQITSLHLCGISLGGMVAAAVSAKYPTLVRSLVLCSTASKLPPPPGGWDGRASAVLAQGMAAFADGMIQRMISASHLATNDPAVDTLRTVFMQADPRGFAGACAVLRDCDLSNVLPLVKAGTLVITGALDALMPPGTAETLISHLKARRHVNLPCGHFPPLEDPEGFVREVQASITELS